MTNSPVQKYDLEERTSTFGENIIDLCNEFTHDLTVGVSSRVRTSSETGRFIPRSNDRGIARRDKAAKTSVATPIISQLIRSATSIGANYCEANGASSKKDFRNKIFTCKKEAKETKFWLRMLAKAVESQKTACRTLWQEAHEFTLIFSKISSSSQNK